MNKKSKKDVLKNSIKKFLKRWERRIRSKADCLHRSGDSGCRTCSRYIEDQMEGIVTTIWNFLWEKIQDLMG